MTDEQRAYVHGAIGSDRYRLFRSRNTDHQVNVRNAWQQGNAEYAASS